MHKNIGKLCVHATPFPNHWSVTQGIGIHRTEKFTSCVYWIYLIEMDMNCEKSFLRKKPTHQSTMRNIITLNKQNYKSSNFPERTEINTCLWGNKSPIFDLFASIQLSMNPRRAVDICLNCKFTTKHIQSKPLRIKTQSIVYKFYYGTPFRIHLH